MPRRAILSATERVSLRALPEHHDDLIRYYTLHEQDISLIRQHRGDANRLGFAVQLCLLRYPGHAFGHDMTVAEGVIHWVAHQIQVDASVWMMYGVREETRREHIQELRVYLGLSAFALSDFRFLLHHLTDVAMQTDKGLVLATNARETLRQRQIMLPTLTVIERVCAEAVTRANQRVYQTLSVPLTDLHRQRLDDLLTLKPDSVSTWLVWLRQSPLKPNARHMLEHIARLKAFLALALPDDIGRHIHQNRMLKLAREGAQMTPHDLSTFTPSGATPPSSRWRWKELRPSLMKSLICMTVFS